MINNIIKYSRLLLLVALIGFCYGSACAGIKAVTIEQITVRYKPLADGTIEVIDAYSDRSRGSITLIVDKNSYKIQAGGSAYIKKIAQRIVAVRYSIGAKGGGRVVWCFKSPAAKTENSVTDKSGKKLKN